MLFSKDICDMIKFLQQIHQETNAIKNVNGAKNTLDKPAINNAMLGRYRSRKKSAI